MLTMMTMMRTFVRNRGGDDAGVGDAADADDDDSDDDGDNDGGDDVNDDDDGDDNGNDDSHSICCTCGHTTLRACTHFGKTKFTRPWLEAFTKRRMGKSLARLWLSHHRPPHHRPSCSSLRLACW